MTFQVRVARTELAVAVISYSLWFRRLVQLNLAIVQELEQPFFIHQKLKRHFNEMQHFAGRGRGV
jgi:hypothetical protein